VKIYEIDGATFSTFDEFVAEINRLLFDPGRPWHGDFNAFNDRLRGGWGTPDEGFTLRWVNHRLSQERLGTNFDLLVEIIRDHGPGGDEPEDKVELVLD
jgi:hypothetical protein